MVKKLFVLSFIVTVSVSLFVLSQFDISNSHEIYRVQYSDLVPSVRKQIDCLSQNIYHEARGESYEGQMAVAFTTLNRVNDPHWPKTICEVVQQKTDSTCQFSWWCDRKIKLKPLDSGSYEKCREVAMFVYIGYGKFDDITASSTFYHADYVNPQWDNVTKTKKIGRHIFYKLNT